MERFTEGALRVPRVAFPPFDELAVRRAERVRRTTALHGRFRERHLVVQLRDRGGGRRRVSREDRAVSGELAVFERHRLLRLVEHRGELEVGRELAIDRVHRVRELAPLGRVRRQRTREPAEGGSGRGDDRGHEIGHDPIVPRPLCIHRAHAFDTSSVCCAVMLRPRDRTLATPYFPVGGPVPAADLVGRETYLRRLTERLEDGQHVLISGPRRIGKTSIIIEALRRLRRRGAYTAYVDCLGATDIRGLGERLADAVLQNLSGVERSFEQAKAIAAGMQPTVKVKYEHVELALQLARETNAQRFFEGALDLAQGLAKRSGKRVVVVLDEFQAAGRLGPRVFEVMRTRFQAHRGVSYAFLGSEQGILEELFSAKGHAFYRFAVPLDLTDAGGHRFGIDPDDWLEYLRSKFAAKKMTIDDASVDRLLDATGGHPQDTMQVCAALYYLMRDAGSRSVTPDLLEVAYEQAMRELERPFALHWTELGSHKYLQQVAKRIAHRAVLYAADADGGAVPRPEVLRALAALQERGLAVRLGRGRYDFVEPMFGEYVRRLDEGLVTAGTVPSR